MTLSSLKYTVFIVVLFVSFVSLNASNTLKNRSTVSPPPSAL